MDWIRRHIAASPKAALVVGKTVFLAGCLLILAALFGRLQLVAANTERAAAGLPALRKLADAFPQYPTWLVPEGPVGYVVAALLVLAGMALTLWAGEARDKASGRSMTPW